MYLTISKRLEFSASYRYYVRDWSDQQNRDFFGSAVGSEHGYGGNFVAYFVFHGPVDDRTGMLINVTTIKERIGPLLAERYDHKFLNGDTPPFDRIVPTPENVARQLLEDARPLFEDESASLVACHLEQTPHRGATAYASGQTEQHHWLEFSAARRTWSPHLSEEENKELFGLAAAPSGHGHHYRLRITLRGQIDPVHGFIVPDRDVADALQSVHTLLDHRNLNTDVAELRNSPITTECLAQFIFMRLEQTLPVSRVMLRENPWFFAGYDNDGSFKAGVVDTFQAAHRLHSPHLSDKRNRDVYDICNNPRGHGHQYRIEATIAGALDRRSGILFPLDRLQAGVRSAIEPWAFKHLDRDTDDFQDRPSTSENIVRVLWPRMEDGVGHPLHRLRLWETRNNRFTLRRQLT